jgi:ATP/maltotriose-dependent transcriptional regulator MalT
LFVSEATIKTHLLHIYDKLGVRDRAGAVGEAYKRRMLT